MTIEIDVLNGNSSWPMAKPLFDAIWPPEIIAKLSWAGVMFANAELRVLLQDETGAAVCHVGLYRREITWNRWEAASPGIGRYPSSSMISSCGPFQNRIVCAHRPSIAARAVRVTRSAAVKYRLNTEVSLASARVRLGSRAEPPTPVAWLS